MKNLFERVSFRSPSVMVLLSVAIIFGLLLMPLPNMHSSAQSGGKSDGRRDQTDKFETSSLLMDGIPAIPGFELKGGGDPRTSGDQSLVGTNQGSESEPNDTFGTADALTGTEGKIKGYSLSGGPSASSGTDTDFYSFTTTQTNSKIYAATMTSASGGGTDTILAVIASDGTTILESDDQDGSFGGSSSTISGTNLATIGTYYLRVTNFSATANISPYDLYFAVRTGTPTAETEPNNNGTPQAIPVSQYVSGAIDPVADTDTFSFSANAGDTVYLSLDLDPERDVTNFNGRIAIGVFGTPGNFLVTSDGGTGDTIDSEAMFMTVKTSGTYQVYVDSQTAGQGGPTATYAFNLSVIPAVSGGTCTTYTNSTSTPLTDLALTSSTINIPDSKIIRSVRATVDITHTNFPDLDVSLRSPSSNDNGLFTDVGVSTQTGAQSINLDDEAAVPQLFTVVNGIIYRPELPYRLDWFRGENTQGTWTLDVRDDTTANTGTLNSWSLEVCEEPSLVGTTLVYSQDFESGAGGYTHTGTADEWELGLPATVATTTTNPVAAFSSCASGTNCWKTDLDNTYDINSAQDLTSPSISLVPNSGAINLYWQSRFQMESTSFDRIWVRVTEVGNPTNTRIVWNSDNATMVNAPGNPAVNIPASAGWGRYSANISDFAGKNIQVNFHLDSDSTVNFGGFAVDDVSIRAPAGSPSTISGRVTDPGGRGIANVQVTLTETNGTKYFAWSNTFGYFKFFNILNQQNVTLSAKNKRFTFTDLPVPLSGSVSVAWVGVPAP